MLFLGSHCEPRILSSVALKGNGSQDYAAYLLSFIAKRHEAKQPKFMGGFSCVLTFRDGIFKLGLLRHRRPPIRRAFLAMTPKLRHYETAYFLDKGGYGF